MNIKTAFERIPWTSVILVVGLTAFFARVQQNLIGGIVTMAALLTGYGLATFAIRMKQNLRLALIVVAMVFLLIVSGWTITESFWQLSFVAVVGLLLGGVLYDPQIKSSQQDKT